MQHSKFLRIIGQIFAFDEGENVPFFNTLVQDEPLNSLRREIYFDTFSHVGVAHECDRRTDRKTFSNSTL